MPLIAGVENVASEGAKAPFFISGTGVVFLLIVVAMSPFLLGAGGSWVFDDYSNILVNPAFASPLTSARDWWEAIWSSPSSDLSRPLAMLSLLLNFHASGLTPLGFKLTNLALHAVNGFLLFVLLRDILRQPAADRALRSVNLEPARTALFLAMAWSALSIHTSAILLIVQRMELLATTFVICGLILYLRGRMRLSDNRAGAWWRMVAGLLVIPALGCLAKETAILTPIYALALEIYLLRFLAAHGQASRVLAGVHGLIVSMGLLATALLLPRYLDSSAWQWRPFDLPERLLTEGRVLWLYVRWTLLPDLSSMGLYHDGLQISRGWLHPPTTALAAAGWLAVILLLARLSLRASLLGLGVAWFVIAHALTATVLPLELVFEHRNYFASAGLLLAWIPVYVRLCQQSQKIRRLANLALGLWLGAQMSIAALRAYEWSSPLRHAQAEAARNPESPRAVYELARVQFVLAEKDPTTPAFAAAQRNFERAARLAGSSAMPAQGLILSEALTGRAVSAGQWELLHQNLRSRPVDVQSAGAIFNLVRCQIVGECAFPVEQLLVTMNIAANQQPPHVDVLSAYAELAIDILGDAPLAEQLARDALQRDPRNPTRRFNLARILAVAGKLDTALLELERLDAGDRIGRYRSKSQQLRELINRRRATHPLPATPVQ